METPTTPAAEGSAPAATTPTPSERPSAKEILAALTPEQRRLAATGKFDQIKLPAATATTPASETAQAAQASAPEAPVADSSSKEASDAAPAADSESSAEVETSGEGSESSSSKSKRFRFTDERDQAIVLIAKSRNVSLLDAAKIYEADSGKGSGATDAPAPETPVAPAPDARVVAYDEGVAKAQKLVQELTAERKKANDDLDTDKVLELSDRIAEARAEVKLLENEKQGYLRNREQETAKGYQHKVNESRDRAFAEYTVFKNPESMERLALDTYVSRALADPSRQKDFADQNWPEKLVKEFATKQGIKPQASAAGSAPANTPAAQASAPSRPGTLPKAQPQQVAPTGAKLLTGADGQRPPSAPRALTREDAMNAIRTDPEARKAIVRNLHKLTPTGQRR